MTLLRRFLVPLVAAALAVGVVTTVSSAATPDASPSAAPVTYSLTVAGTDAHPLDPRTGLMFHEGGGVEIVFESGKPQVLEYIEVNFNLPVGAKVTSIAIVERNCTGATNYFGSYQPATSNTVQTTTISVPKSCTLKTVTKTGNPIVTTVAGRRYALDVLPGETYQYPGAVSGDIFYGATLKYTCTSPCAP